jgi:hypothetical protein
MGLLERIVERRTPARSITTIDDYLAALGSFNFNGNSYPLGGVQQTLAGQPVERIADNLIGLAAGAYASHGPIFACMLIRSAVFSAISFRWQRMSDGRGSEMFGTSALDILQRPWLPGGTTQDLLSRMIQDADLAGSSYSALDVPLARLGGDDRPDIVRLRPDWVDIVMRPRFINGGHVGWRKVGYVYREGGEGDLVPLLLSEVAHFAPQPDPLANWRGMSWLTPVIREIQNDKLMSAHQREFFRNGATPNMVVRMPERMSADQFRQFTSKMDDGHRGVENAYKTLYLGGGADVTVVGKDFKQVDFTALQGRSESRIAQAANVPAVLAGFAEGLEASTYSNYAQARRRFADGTMHPLWQNAAGSLAPLMPDLGADVRLWYDATNVPFLREDERDHAEIQQMQANTIRSLIDAGYEPKSVVAAVDAGDWRLLVHSGLYSVQLQAAGADATTPPALPAGDDDA